ncbi:hypothetical protein PCH_Pc21g23050 [Penicillium rubens Wisconsin 54-1255]|uniref:Uncharacterized protein n=1 Tax=Penicillium rubens (strain ATCC 28089 / DSM 1075 / NRRL 1951 / Wisconsin 54-1255) TaxID=500485 RepID=B6HHV7_PENRW|nr:hypothetical protein PCH_Pc21g23050 [Penicillium rubens Wisconsin 54-1255]
MGKGTKCSGIATGACASFLSQRGPEECDPVIGWIATRRGLFTIPYPGNVFQMNHPIPLAIRSNLPGQECVSGVRDSAPSGGLSWDIESTFLSRKYSGAYCIFPRIDKNPLFHRNQHVRMLASRQAIYSQSRQAPVPAKPQRTSQRTRLGNPVLSCSHLGIAISFSRVEAGRQQRIPWNSFVILGGCPRT